MERKTRVEPIEEYFFESPIWDDEGNFIPAPPEALSKYSELQVEWMMNQPKSRTEIPGVAIYPIQQTNRVGYLVVTQVIYKPNST